VTGKLLAVRCGDCDGQVVAAHGPYRNEAGRRICAVCNVRRQPELAAIITTTLASFGRSR